MILVTILWCLLQSLMFEQLAHSGQVSDIDKSGYKEFPLTGSLVFNRFVCTVILHFILVPEAMQGLNLMKYALNHHEKFEAPKIAWLIGFFQFTMLFGIELTNSFIMLTQ